MSNRPCKPYRILLTEVRVYEIEICSDTDYDLEDWAREGWGKAAPGAAPDCRLVERRLAKVTVHEKSVLPWSRQVEIKLTV